MAEGVIAVAGSTGEEVEGEGTTTGVFSSREFFLVEATGSVGATFSFEIFSFSFLTTGEAVEVEAVFVAGRFCVRDAGS